MTVGTEEVELDPNEVIVTTGPDGYKKVETREELRIWAELRRKARAFLGLAVGDVEPDSQAVKKVADEVRRI